MGTVLWIFWAGTGCLIYFINAIIWRDNVTNWAPVWCDIGECQVPGIGAVVSEHVFRSVTRFLHVQPIGICLASALINHRLYKLSKLSVTFTSAADVSCERFSATTLLNSQPFYLMVRNERLEL